jgi:hypothetical protein
LIRQFLWYYLMVNKCLRTSATALAGACILTIASPLAAGAHAATSATYLYNCSTPTQRPREIVVTCADAGRYLANITWSKWSGATAHAKGILHWNTCTPTCSAGKMKSSSITFTATDRRDVKGTWLYTELRSSKNTWGTGSAVWALPTSAL